MALYQNEVGNKIYVWSKSQGKPTSSECVISAHGRKSIINSNFPVTGPTLAFYCPHGSSLIHSELEDVILKNVTPNQIVEGGRCQDYELSKYQGNHSESGETYQKISNLADALDSVASDSLGRCERGKRNYGSDWAKRTNLQETVDYFFARFVKYGQWMDIVTIRNRRLRTNPMLSDVIKALAAAGYKYRTINCSFGRSNSSDDQ